MDDTDLGGLDLAAAREYIFAYSVDIKRLEKESAELETELGRWRGRVSLAEGKLAAAGASTGDASAMAGLAEAARAKVAELEGKLGTVQAERAELRAKVARMREQLPMIQARERSIDPDRLLAELQLMTGELLGESGGADGEGRGAAATEADFRKLESDQHAESELEALKRRLGGGA
jgi:chromosome segregation ATPase